MPESLYGAISIASSRVYDAWFWWLFQVVWMDPVEVVFDGAVCGAPFLVWRHYLGETVGVDFRGAIVPVRPMCPVPNVGTSFSLPVSPEKTVYPQVGPLDPVDGSSQHFYHCALIPWALVPEPALVLDSFLSLVLVS